MPYHRTFDPKRPLVAAKGFTFFGREYAPGDAFPHDDDAASIPARAILRQFESRAVSHPVQALPIVEPEPAPEPDAASPQIIMEKGVKRGEYVISGDFDGSPLTIAGKANAQAKLAELIAAAQSAENGNLDNANSHDAEQAVEQATGDEGGGGDVDSDQDGADAAGA